MRSRNLWPRRFGVALDRKKEKTKDCAMCVAD